ncbi:MAG: FMN-binding negative transcriptional regulator, partial [Pseudomonadota bacterium]
PLGPQVAHLPMLLTETDTEKPVLQGHLARANPLLEALTTPQSAMALFHGPAAYVSPGWYASKTQDSRVVPTWNYAVVHVSGLLSANDDSEWLQALIVALTDRQEARQSKPWAVTDAPPDYIDRLTQHIVGVELTIEDVIGKWKLSQNRSAEDRASVRHGLMQSGDPASQSLAALMAGIEAE